jgi:hypothetical protein
LQSFFRVKVTVLFGGIVTSKSPLRAVRGVDEHVLVQSVSPTLAVAFPGEITRFSVTIFTVAASAGTAIAPTGR